VRIGIVSAGAMGSAVGRALQDGGAEVVTTLAGRSERTVRLAAEAELECLPDIDAVVAASELVLSIAPPSEALTIAASLSQAARRTAASPFVADLNAVSPDTVRRVESQLAAPGLDLVDGSISGPPPRAAGTTRIYLSGPRAREVAALPFAGVSVIVVGDAIGLASAVKMCTASIYKGSTALLAQALLTAHANGVLEHVLDDLGERADGAGRSIARAATKSARYVGEMHEIASTQAAAGLTPALFEAMAEVYAALARTPLALEDAEHVPADIRLDRVLSELLP
jgi:3-hydroxyisobutyrate dehydrogenase-like beta-hydroxyacid dehydrogenase